MNGRPNIVLVHGAWAEGSCWSGVIERLQTDGFHVRAPQFPLSSLADDVARLSQVLEFQDGPTLVVGHSYGGQIMTALGADAPNVVGLVYIAAFGLDEGESLGALLSQGPVTPALAHLFTDARGFGWLSEDDFVDHFAGDVGPTQARVLYAMQQPLASSAFERRHGRPGLEDAAFLVSGCPERRGDPARRRATVRRANGRDHRRDPLEPRRDGLAPERGRGPHREGRRVGRFSRGGDRQMSAEAVSPITTYFRVCDGVRVRFADTRADSDITVLLLAPWPESLWAFRRIWDRVSAVGRVVAIDLPGFGHSDGRPELIAPDASGAFLARLIDEWGLGAPHVVGPDVGTAAALFLAAKAPERVTSLTIGGGAVRFPIEAGGALKDIIEAPSLDVVRGLDARTNIGYAVESGAASDSEPEVHEDYVSAYDLGRFAESARFVRHYPEQNPVLRDLLPIDHHADPDRGRARR